VENAAHGAMNHTPQLLSFKFGECDFRRVSIDLSEVECNEKRPSLSRVRATGGYKEDVIVCRGGDC
jgi:hypothetical protein